uniref:Uncharacterized protein n=1 Tax=Chromera velia CCMP2878 TaxID=1169474 RepID=A0A0G4HW10_9ALVE|eukprot:Cvel_32361.t1-p1 / transcript=Cvel_32361.t1 / gene=Cvel_32361 / organism=Chromera_velia_CCMP2878 / gene_product=hypothetical protein / transcript_product=hypothetical protein / location=Cvel_scaffold5024:1965-3527(+) / protein_length=126 / sequence_SO=supercontig / SO=protein_coding / is_pseudo=false
MLHREAATTTNRNEHWAVIHRSLTPEVPRAAALPRKHVYTTRTRTREGTRIERRDLPTARRGKKRTGRNPSGETCVRIFSAGSAEEGKIASTTTRTSTSTVRNTPPGVSLRLMDASWERVAHMGTS